MPLYRFWCAKCELETTKLLKHSDPNPFCGECGSETARQLPNSLNTAIMEMRDRHRNVQLKKGHEKQLKQRMKEHHYRYELEEKIDKYGLKEAERSGWTKNIKKI